MNQAPTCAALALILVGGPLRAATYHVNQASPAAADGNPGAAAKPFQSISAAAAIVDPSDTVLVAPGTYRERVAPAQGGKNSRTSRWK